MLRVVIDTNIYISAIFWSGKPRRVIDLGRDNRIQIFSSEEIEEEISKILTNKFGLSLFDTDLILTDFSTFSNPVRIRNRMFTVKDDPDDDKFIDCAVECSAGYIISGDKHLLSMKKYKGIDIITASAFLEKFEKI